MANTTSSPYTQEQIIAWFRGLLTIAWSDGDYDPHEQELIAKLTQELAYLEGEVPFQAITPDELAKTLAADAKTAENFMRTAVLVAVADGVYTNDEATLLRSFSGALGVNIQALESLEHTLYHPVEHLEGNEQEHPHPNLLHPIQEWLDGMEIHDPKLARFLCKMIPPQCPFERDIKLFGHKIVHIPPLCKLNPLYEQLVTLRFRSLSYLADECKEDISGYI